MPLGHPLTFLLILKQNVGHNFTYCVKKAYGLVQVNGFGLFTFGIRQIKVLFRYQGMHLLAKIFLTSTFTKSPTIIHKRLKKKPACRPLGLGVLMVLLNSRHLVFIYIFLKKKVFIYMLLLHSNIVGPNKFLFDGSKMTPIMRQ